MFLPGRLALAGALLAGVSGCARLNARTPGPVAALEMPTPPARSLVPVVLPDSEEPVVPIPDTLPSATLAARPREAPSAPPRQSAERPAATPSVTPAQEPAAV